MNQQSKRAIKSLVLTLRRKLEDDIAIQLKRYGFAGERWLPLERLPHIERDDTASADHFRLHAALEQHLRRIDADPAAATAQQRAEAVDWFVREVAFTHLNRLVALKVQEVRGLIPEIITARDAYGGRSRAHYDYRNAHPDEARAADDALPAAIRHACRQVYAEFKLLFDVGDPSENRHAPVVSILWPSFPVLKECIALINGLDAAAGLAPANNAASIAEPPINSGLRVTHYELPQSDASHSAPDSQPPPSSLWQEDEIIGWIYQFYNAEQKEAIRRQGKPQRPAEVAVINQFFTPRWIVKFLVDNTLGRLWLEMHPDSPRVRAKCDYLVPEPVGGELGGTQGSSGELGGVPASSSSSSSSSEFRLDPDSPINNPKAPARRTAKHPTELRLIDPACGTMHFGHYAFEVFQAIYADYNDYYADASGHSSVIVPHSEIPSAILRYNLYGVDIDLRAVQLAGLSLFIKAKSANPDAHITHLNLVVADAVLPADGVRQRFLDQYKGDRVVQQAVATVLDEMANVAEVGSLLRVEERLRSILARAGHSAVADLDPQRQKPLPGLEPGERQLSLAEIAEAAPEEWDAHYTLERLLDDLRAFAAKALQMHDLNAQLFAEEAEKSVHLLDVFLNSYDIALMNPPYGGTTDGAKSYLAAAYPATKSDLYAAFLERAADLTARQGYVGALTSRTFIGLSTFQKLRRSILLEQLPPVAIIDLGFGVLDDALVETAASVFGWQPSSRELRNQWACFFRLLNEDSKQQVFEQQISDLRFGSVSRRVFVTQTRDFSILPEHNFAYWAPRALIEIFTSKSSLSSTYGDLTRGLFTSDDGRFLRNWWEVRDVAPRAGWVSFSKGGDYSKYYYDPELVVDWRQDGAAMKQCIVNKYTYLKGNYAWCIPNEQAYLSPGITYPLTTVKGFNARLLTQGYMWGHVGPVLILHEESRIWSLLGVLNSSTVAMLLDMITIRNFETGYVGSLPMIEPEELLASTVGSFAKLSHDIKAEWDICNELCTRFDAPWLVQARLGTLLAPCPDLLPTSPPINQSIHLPALLDHLIGLERAADARLQALQAEIDGAVYDLYEITPEDQTLIERELGDQPPELVWPQMAGKSEPDKRQEHVRRLLSWSLLQALREKRDGLLPLVPVAGQESALDAVRRGLEAEFGEQAAFAIEDDIRQVLGKPIAAWLDGEFVKWHTKLYKSRPVVWHLASPRNTFGCFLYIHKLDRDTLRKVQTLYLWPFRRGVQAGLEAARREAQAGTAGAGKRVEQAELALEDLAEFEKRLLRVIQAEVKCDIPDWAEGPYRNGAYDPVLDDGVKVNIAPLQAAEVLRYRKMV